MLVFFVGVHVITVHFLPWY